MKRPADSLHFRDEDRQLLTIPGLSQQARISQAFIRVCLVSGCPSPGGLISQAILIDWLVENYQKVRELSGLKEMLSLEEFKGESLAKRKMAYAILTLLEFGESRSSCPREKEQMHWIRMAIECSLECE